MNVLFLIRLFMDAATETKGGGFTPEEKAELATGLNEVKTAIERGVKAEVEAALKKNQDAINEAVTKFNDFTTTKTSEDLENQKALNDVLTRVKEMQDARNAGGAARVEAKSLQQAVAEALADPENQKGIASVGRGNRYKMMLKGPIDMSAGPVDMFNPNVQHKGLANPFESKLVGDMTAANNLTGQGVVNYGGRQVILPAQKINARDLIPTVRSETGTYVFFRETGQEGSISRQTAQGATKTQIDFDFARVEVVSEYIAGWTKFAKQLMRQLPFLQNTLPRLLQREFFKVENRRFYDIMATAYAAGGTPSGTTETDDIKEIIDAIAALFDADYVASYGLLRWKAMARIEKYLLTNGNYFGSGGVALDQNGVLRVMGVPVIPVSWIPSSDKFLTFDNDYVERIEVESLAIEFFEQDDKNVQQNLITARIECFEEFNAMQPKAIVLEDLDNSSTS